MAMGDSGPANQAGARGRVLIIDDEADFADYLRNVAVMEGFEAKLVTNLSDFAMALDRFDPTVVIMDMVMPDTDGFEILRLLVARQSSARILIVSGYTPLYLGCAVKMAQGLGLDDLITLQKPVKLKDLRAALTEPPAAFAQPPRDRGQARQAGAD
jgi:DNA-binding response OmpR family regulator